MTPAEWTRVRELFHAAIDQAPEERSGYLRDACGDNPQLRAEVDRLLRAHADAGSFIEATPLHAIASPAPLRLHPGQQIGRYEIISLLGAGGMGEVYRARDPRLERNVAIKIILPAFNTEPDRLRRFEQEARAAAALNHPNVLAVYDVGADDGQPYIVSEFLEGETLRDGARAGRLPLNKVIDYAIQICRGLIAAHDTGIVHRDLKPENLFITQDGRVKILDFGLAKLTEGRRLSAATAVGGKGVTIPDAVVGTIGYMSPEQISGRPTDYRSDLFSAGAVLYELCSGQRAFHGETAVEILNAVVNDPPGELRDTDPLSEGLHKVVRRCLEKNPRDRFQSARDLAFTLETLVGMAASRAGRRPTPSVSSPAAHVGAIRLIVLAFENVSRQPDDEWLAIAFTDSLTFGLRNAENIIILDREHSDGTADPRRLVETLDVRYCVKGSVQRVGNSLKVVARLIDTATGAIALQESVTDSFSNLLSLEETIAVRFAAAFEAPHSGPAPNRTSSLAAYKRLVLASELYRTGHYQEAVQHLDVAITQDAQYSDAFALLAKCYARLTSPHSSDDHARHEFQRKALRAARLAAELDPSLYEAQIALALAYRGTEEVELWRMASLKAIELNPRMAEAFVLLGQSYFAGPAWGFARHRDSDLAERYFRKAIELNPRFGLGHNALINHLIWDGRAADALVAADNALALLPDHVDLLRARARALLRLHRTDASEEQLQRLSAESATTAQDEWALAAIDLLRGHLDRAARRLEAVIARGPRAVREIDTALIYCQAGLFTAAAQHLASARLHQPESAVFVSQNPAFAAYRDHPAIAVVLR